MPGQHTECAFEAAIEHHRTATGGYTKGAPETYLEEPT
jgi:hypothetical protein